jgi:anti-sigma B factor antagonist
LRRGGVVFVMGAARDLRDLAHAVVVLRGEFDLARAGEVREDLYRALEQGLPIVIDLSETTFLDTVTLGILLEGVRRSRKSSREVVIYLPESAGRQVRDLFRITGFDEVLPVVHQWGTAKAPAPLPPGYLPRSG